MIISPEDAVLEIKVSRLTAFASSKPPVISLTVPLVCAMYIVLKAFTGENARLTATA